MSRFPADAPKFVTVADYLGKTIYHSQAVALSEHENRVDKG